MLLANGPTLGLENFGLSKDGLVSVLYPGVYAHDYATGNEVAIGLDAFSWRMTLHEKADRGMHSHSFFEAAEIVNHCTEGGRSRVGPCFPYQ